MEEGEAVLDGDGGRGAKGRGGAGPLADPEGRLVADPVVPDLAWGEGGEEGGEGEERGEEEGRGLVGERGRRTKRGDEGGG